jgi:hypothetical protein
VPTRIRFAIARLGTKAGKARSLNMLVGPSELPGEGWKVLDERTWRTGALGSASEWAKRARAAGSITAWRSFENSSDRRWLWLEVVPLASNSDSEAAVRDVPSRGMANAAAPSMQAQRDVANLAVPGVDNVWGVEQDVVTRQGEPGQAKMLAGTHKATLLVVTASGLVAAWSWDDVSAIAALVSARIEAGISGEAP